MHVYFLYIFKNYFLGELKDALSAPKEQVLVRCAGNIFLPWYKSWHKKGKESVARAINLTTKLQKDEANFCKRQSTRTCQISRKVPYWVAVPIASTPGRSLKEAVLLVLVELKVAFSAPKE